YVAIVNKLPESRENKLPSHLDERLSSQYEAVVTTQRYLAKRAFTGIGETFLAMVSAATLCRYNRNESHTFHTHAYVDIIKYFFTITNKEIKREQSCCGSFRLMELKSRHLLCARVGFAYFILYHDGIGQEVQPWQPGQQEQVDSQPPTSFSFSSTIPSASVSSNACPSLHTKSSKFITIYSHKSTNQLFWVTASTSSSNAILKQGMGLRGAFFGMQHGGTPTLTKSNEEIIDECAQQLMNNDVDGPCLRLVGVCQKEVELSSEVESLFEQKSPEESCLNFTVDQIHLLKKLLDLSARVLHWGMIPWSHPRV
ncbi:hypothetical protein G9A89_015468, partial [Geosiphon pyriformis]